MKKNILVITIFSIVMLFSACEEQEMPQFDVKTFLTEYHLQLQGDSTTVNDIEFCDFAENGTTGYALLKSIGDSPCLYLYKYEKINENVTIKDWVKTQLHETSRIFINYIVDGDRYIYFGEIGGKAYENVGGTGSNPVFNKMVITSESGNKVTKNIKNKSAYVYSLSGDIVRRFDILNEQDKMLVSYPQNVFTLVEQGWVSDK